MSANKRPDAGLERIGADLMRAAADYALEDPKIRKALTNGLFFRGTVTGVQYSGATSTVTVRRTGRPGPDTVPYPVYDTFYRPVIGDQVLLAYVDQGNACVIGARNAGRPNEWTVAGGGGALLKFDSQRRLLERHDDSHNRAHFRKDGKRVAHHQKEDGTHARLADELRVIKGAIAADGTVSGSYHRKSADTLTTGTLGGGMQHFHNMGDGAGERLILQHHPHKHTHTTYSKGGRGVKGDHTKDYKGYTLPAGHALADDGSDSAINDPTSGPTLAAIAAPNPTSLAAGSYQVTYCFTNNPGVAGSTNPAPAQTISIDAGQNIVVSAITLPGGASGIDYYVSDGADSTNLKKYGSGTGGAFTITGIGTGAALPTSNTTYVTDPTHAPTVTPSTASGTLPAGIYNVAYAFTTSWGLSRISPITKVTLSAPGNLAISGMDALPALANGLNVYITPPVNKHMLALQLAVNQATNANVTISATPPKTAATWPSASSAYVPDPTAQATLTANTVTTTTALGAGTWHVSYALSVDNAGTQHTAMSPSSAVVLTAGQAIQAGPVELPPNASYVQWFMETAAASGTQRLVSVVQVSDAQVFTSAPSAGGTAPFGSNTTGANVSRGAVVLSHGGGNKAIRHTGCDFGAYSAGSLNMKLSQDKHHLHIDGSGVVQHVLHAAGHKMHLGDHYHGVASFTANLADCANALIGLGINGPYIRHTRNAGCDNAHETYIHDGTSEKIIKAHGPNKGHTIHASDGTVQHHHAVKTVGSTPKGSKHHTGDHVHNADGGITVACDGTVTLSGNYQRKTVESDGAGGMRYAHYHQTTKVRHHHPTSGEHAFHFNGTMHMQIAASGNGAKSRHKQHGTSSFHEHGDDGSGNLAHVRAGVQVYKHEGTKVTHYNNGGRTLVHDQNGNGGNGQMEIWFESNGETFGPLHKFVRNGQYGAARMEVKQHLSNTGYHLIGDLGDTYMSTQHQSGTKHVQHQNGHEHWHSGWKVHTLSLQGGGRSGYLQNGAPNSNGPFHAVGDDGGGNIHLAHASGNRAFVHDGTSAGLYGGGGVLGLFTNTSVMNGRGDGGTLRLRAGGSYHIQGDYGNGQFYNQHAGGTVMMTHDNTTHAIRGAHGAGHVTDGYSTRIFDTGQSNYDGGGSPQLILSSYANNGGAGGGGTVSYRRYSDSYYHRHGDFADNNFSNFSVADHKHYAGNYTGRAQTTQTDQYLGSYGQQSRYGDDSGHIKHVPQGWSGSIGTGALSKDSVSNAGGSTYTTGTSSVPGYGTSVPGTGLGGGGRVATVGGDNDYGGHHSKIVGIDCWYNVQGGHRLAGASQSRNWGYGTESDGDTRLAYSNSIAYGDAAVDVFGATTSGPNWQGNITVTYHRWN